MQGLWAQYQSRFFIAFVQCYIECGDFLGQFLPQRRSVVTRLANAIVVILLCSPGEPRVYSIITSHLSRWDTIIRPYLSRLVHHVPITIILAILITQPNRRDILDRFLHWFYYPILATPIKSHLLLLLMCLLLHRLPCSERLEVVLLVWVDAPNLKVVSKDWNLCWLVKHGFHKIPMSCNYTAYVILMYVWNRTT